MELNKTNKNEIFYDLIEKSLTMYHSDEKVRLGNENDGGYIIVEMDNYDYLLSGGVGGDISFEKEFTDKYNVKCSVFDGTDDTAEQLCKNESNITFVKKNIGFEENYNTTNLKNIINKYNNIFLKMDIEGGEWPFILSLTLEELNKFKQITLELHFPNSQKHWEQLYKITQTHYLIHYHANNNNHILYSTRQFIEKPKSTFTIPAVFECTYVRKDFFKNPPPLNTEPLPSKLDKRNTVNKLDYLIDCKPWVHKK
tara:strand:- start:157 stop:918 length:762 start_codon:yes stop_codon:yes gene_type:complete